MMTSLIILNEKLIQELIGDMLGKADWIDKRMGVHRRFCHHHHHHWAQAQAFNRLGLGGWLEG